MGAIGWIGILCAVFFVCLFSFPSFLFTLMFYQLFFKSGFFVCHCCIHARPTYCDIFLSYSWSPHRSSVLLSSVFDSATDNISCSYKGSHLSHSCYDFRCTWSYCILCSILIHDAYANQVVTALGLWTSFCCIPSLLHLRLEWSI